MSGGMVLKGDRELLALLGELPKRLRDKTLTQAVMAGGAPIKAAMVTNAPAATGLLKKSIKIRKKKYQNGNVAVGVIGPARGMKTTVSAVESGKNKGKLKRNTRANMASIARYGSGAVYYDPANYGHLVEGGRKAVRPIRAKALYNRLTNRVFMSAAAVPAKRFASRAFSAASGSAAEAMRQKMTEGLAAEASSLASKGG